MAATPSRDVEIEKLSIEQLKEEADLEETNTLMLDDSEKVLVDVETGYFIEKTMAEGKDYCDQKSDYDRILEVADEGEVSEIHTFGREIALNDQTRSTITSQITMDPCESSDHHQNPTQFPPPPTNCAKCGGPTCTSFPPPPSPTPSYIPIRLPAVNLPSSPTNTKEAIMRTPVPHAQKVDPITRPHTFSIPSKRIHSPDDVAEFHSSPAFHNFLGFVVSLSEAVRSRKLSDPVHVSAKVGTVLEVIEKLAGFVDEIVPAPMSARYGNVAYRTWHERMCGEAVGFMMEILGGEWKEAVVELVPYFVDSFGNSSRIDYGTGHETNFAAWLYCLARLGIVREEDYPALVLKVFVKYLDLMRKLQLTYCLEPAGSHGVWGLDDYHFLPFIFGSSQLIDHKYMKPKSIHNDDILENFSKEYLYLSCIVFVKKVKKGLFAEHSPMLDDITGVPTWNKVNSGLLKMYRIEVLEKVPVMQHFLFGSIIRWG